MLIVSHYNVTLQTSQPDNRYSYSRSRHNHNRPTHTHRGRGHGNLIVISSLSNEEDSNDSFHNARERGHQRNQGRNVRGVQQNVPNKMPLLRPQDRWAAGISENDSNGPCDSPKLKAQDKFSRIESSESESDDAHESGEEEAGNKSESEKSESNNESDQDEDSANKHSDKSRSPSPAGSVKSSSSSSNSSSSESSNSSRCSTPPKILEESAADASVANSPSKYDRKSKFGRARSRSRSTDKSDNGASESENETEEKSADKPKSEIDAFLNDIDAFLDDKPDVGDKKQKDTNDKKPKDTSESKSINKEKKTAKEKSSKSKDDRKEIDRNTNKDKSESRKHLSDRRSDKKTRDNKSTREIKSRESENRHKETRNRNPKDRTSNKYSDRKHSVIKTKRTENQTDNVKETKKVNTVDLDDSDSDAESRAWREKRSERSSTDIAQERRKRTIDNAKIDQPLEPNKYPRGERDPRRSRNSREPINQRSYANSTQRKHDTDQKRKVQNMWESDSESELVTSKSLLSVPVLPNAQKADRLQNHTSGTMKDQHEKRKRTRTDKTKIPEEKLSDKVKLSPNKTRVSVKERLNVPVKRKVYEKDDATSPKYTKDKQEKMKQSHIVPITFNSNDQSQEKSVQERLSVHKRLGLQSSSKLKSRRNIVDSKEIKTESSRHITTTDHTTNKNKISEEHDTKTIKRSSSPVEIPEDHDSSETLNVRKFTIAEQTEIQPDQEHIVDEPEQEIDLDERKTEMSEKRTSVVRKGDSLHTTRRKVTAVDDESAPVIANKAISSKRERDAVDDLDEKIKRIKERNRKILERQLEIEKEKELYG